MLSVADLHASYGGSLVLQGVDLTVKRGDIKALMGRNGMGKTTLLRSIMGLVKITSGTVRLDGREIQSLAPHEIANQGIGYAPQGREIFDDFTVMDNLRLGLLGYPRKERIVPKEIFEYFPVLAERKNQRAGTFSGGQQQMLAIARALACKPMLLLLDEPSEGIQPSIVEEIAEILSTINRETGLTILIVEQNINMVLELAHACEFMERGRIVGACPIDDIRADESIITKHMSV